MGDETLSPTTAAASLGRPTGATRTALAAAVLAVIACAFAWIDPYRNGWAAAALVLALILDAVGRRATSSVARARPQIRAIGRMPSIVLALGTGPGPWAMPFALGMLVWPEGFPLLASALAGLIAMGAVARLALARIVRQTATADETEGPA